MATLTLLPMDFKGTLASNYFKGEVHTPTKASGKTHRIFKPNFGAYYTDSLIVRDSTGKVLDRDKDYVCTYYYQDLGVASAKEVCAIIVIINAAVTATVRIEYRAVGGPYSLNFGELEAVIAETEKPGDKIKWEDIIDKPLQYNPDDHNHEYWQLYGLESTDENLDYLAKSWITGRKGILENGRIYYQNYVDLAKAAVAAYAQRVTNHVNDKNNPHQTDKVKIQLGNVNNWPMANQAQATAKTGNATYQPIGGIYLQLTAHVTPLFDAHLRNYNNPHNVLLSDPLLNLYSATQINNIFAQKLAIGQVAVDSTLFAGQSLTTLNNEIRSNLHANNVAPNTKFTNDKFAPIPNGWTPSDWVLTGGKQYRRWSDIFAVTNSSASPIYFVGAGNQIGAAAANAVIQSFYAANPSLPDGTWVISQYALDYNDRRMGTSLSIWKKINGVPTGQLGHIQQGWHS